LLYENLADGLFGAPGHWNFKLCPSSDCGLMWLDPIPVEQDIGKAYAQYYTHAVLPTRMPLVLGALQKGLSAVLSFVDPVQRERERLSLMYLGDSKPGKLLDVGCGDGSRLARLRALGWDVHGQDVDPDAVARARETFRVDAHLGPLEDIRFSEMSFDCIILNHVIEHAHDPVTLLRECRRILKRAGLLVVVTPNSRSFGHDHFGPAWRGLEPPRHIHLFSPQTLPTVAVRAGLAVRRSWTTAANAGTFGHGSLVIRSAGHSTSNLSGKLFSRAYALGYLYRSVFEHVRDRDSGEECVLQATR
jgi:2-polyprenyl-3-methyl-5-hydroxy-6-metoxy-1,4-benzoquinol methylase